MYGRSFEDRDRHIWEVMWMDVAAAQAAMAGCETAAACPCEQGPDMTGEPMAEHELSITRRIEAPPPGRLPRLDRADGRMVGAPPVHDPGGRTRSQARRSRLDGGGGAGRNRG